MNAVTFLFISLIPIVLLAIFFFVLSILHRRNDIADVGWAGYFLVTTWCLYLIMTPAFDLRIIPLVLVTIWAIRLSIHISTRFTSHDQEDIRYQTWRNQWGNGWYFYVRSFLQVFLLQGILAWIIMMPVTMVMLFGFLGTSLIFMIVGILGWITGFVFESVADYQLAQFLKNPASRGKLMTTGLWRYSRHPNYFGEALQWISLWVITIGGPFWYISLIGPIVITILLRYVSGVPLAEKTMAQHPDFAKYTSQTSVFIPWMFWRK
jgi:steroid 5-alpha reductase family enzyme